MDNDAIWRCYSRLSRSCQSVNQMRAMHVAFENIMDPQEFGTIANGLVGFKIPGLSSAMQITVQMRFKRLKRKLMGPISATGPSLSRDIAELAWARVLLKRIRRAHRSHGPALSRKWSRGGNHYYESSSGKGGLILAFSGRHGRMGMPTPVILSYLREFDADVMLISNFGSLVQSEKLGFPCSQRDLRIRLEQALGALPKRTHVFSLSQGTTSALLVATMLRLDGVLLSSPVFPDFKKFLEDAHVSGEQLNRALNILLNRCQTSEPVVAYSSDLGPDLDAAREIMRLAPSAREVSISGSPHSVIYPMAEAGALGWLLRKAFS